MEKKYLFQITLFIVSFFLKAALLGWFHPLFRACAWYILRILQSEAEIASLVSAATDQNSERLGA